MQQYYGESGFTLAEMIVTLVVLSLFLGLFFQTYMLSTSQKSAVILQTSANDIAQNNLNKVTKRSEIPSAGACDNTDGIGNTNNLIKNATAPGTVFASGGSWPSPLTPESLTNTGLPSSTTQTLTVIYPQGCDSIMPAKVIATVTYGSEVVIHAAYVGNN